MHQAQLQTCGLGTSISSFFNALDRWQPGVAYASAGSKQMSVWEAVRRTYSEVGTLLSPDASHVQDPHPKLLVMGVELMCSGATGLLVSGLPNMTAFSMRFKA